MTMPWASTDPPRHDLKFHLSEDEALGFLRAIDRGEVTVKPVGLSWDATYAGNVEYVASNGWLMTVFNDCNDWDYIEVIKAPDGREMTFDLIFDNFPEICNWTPTTEAVAAQFYGEPR